MLQLQDLRGLTERMEVETSEGRPSYLLVTRQGHYIRLSPSAYHLLRAIHAGISFDQLAARLSEQQHRVVSVAEVEAAYQRVAAQVLASDQTTQQAPFGFWLRLRLLPAHLVTRIGRLLSIAFQPVLGISLLLGLIATLWSVVQAGSTTLTTSSFGTVYALFLISIVFHELGHASACVRYGVPPSEIGFAIYWIYPVFYSNVSAAWRLKRWQRVVIDLGGAFFQLVIAACYGIIYLWSGWEPARLAILVILYSCVWSLNPILKFDGYWVVSDALGIVNLWQQPRRILRRAIQRCRGEAGEPLPWSTRVTSAVVLYSVLSVGFWIYFSWQLFGIFWNTMLPYPQAVVNLFHDLLAPPHRLAASRIEAILMPTMILFGFALMACNLLRWLFSTLKASLRSIQQRAI